MLIQERFDRMDILTYENEREKSGEQRGEQRGVDKFADLITKLISAGRSSEVKRVASNVQYRTELLKEFQLS